MFSWIHALQLVGTMLNESFICPNLTTLCLQAITSSFSLNLQSAYTEGMKRQLHEMGLGWFAQNPCMSFKDMKRFLDMGVPRDFLRERLDNAKCSIEDAVRRFTLDQKLVTHTDGQFSPERRCVLLGKVGQGKSSFGNLLLGSDEFKVYDTVRSGTQESKYAFSQTHNVHVFDTQGFKDSEGRDVDLDMPKVITKSTYTFSFTHRLCMIVHVL